MINNEGLNSLLTQREDSRTQKGKDHQSPTSHDDRLYVLGCTFYLSTYKVNTEGLMKESQQMGRTSILNQLRKVWSYNWLLYEDIEGKMIFSNMLKDEDEDMLFFS